MNNFDVIVIGAGSVGIPSALYLAEGGMKVLVIDSNSAPGQGQNKAAIGGVRATHSDPAKILICQKSLDIFSTWQEINGDNIGWKTGGYCYPVYDDITEHTLKFILPLQKEYKLNIDWVSPEDIMEIIPGINPQKLRGGTYSPEDGQVSSLKSAVAFERKAKSYGVQFNYREKVTGIETNNNRVVAVITEKDKYYSPLIINAAGACAKQIGQFTNINIPVTPDCHEAGITSPVERFLPPLVVDMRPGQEGKTANFYFGQNDSGAIIFCYTPKPVIWGESRENTSEFLPIISRRMIDLIPRLKHALIRRTWRGLYPMTPDAVPIIGRVDQIEGMFLAVGMCGQGFMMGPGVGKLIASLILTEKTYLPDDIFNGLRFNREFGKSKEKLE